MRRPAAAAAATVLAVLTAGCGAEPEPTEEALISIGFPACQAAEEYGSWVVPARNGAGQDFVVASIATARLTNAHELELGIAPSPDDAPDRADGFVIPARATAYVRVAFAPEDPCEDAVVEGISIEGSLDSEPASIHVVEKARLAAFDDAAAPAEG